MGDMELDEIYDETKERRVIILRRKTGTFYYGEEYFSGHPLEMCWVPKGQRVIGFYDSQEKAESEARANIDWLRDLSDI